MKKVVFSIFFLVLILFLYLFSLGFSEKLKDEMTAMLTDSQINFVVENYGAAHAQLLNAERLWQKKSPILIILVDHGEIYGVEDAIIRLKVYCNNRESTLFLSEMGVLLNKLHDLDHSMEMAHENIF